MFRLNDAEKSALFTVKHESDSNIFNVLAYKIVDARLDYLERQLETLFRHTPSLRYVLIDEPDKPLTKTINTDTSAPILKCIESKDQSISDMVRSWLKQLNHDKYKLDRSCHFGLFTDNEANQYLIIAANRIFIDKRGLIKIAHFLEHHHPIVPIDDTNDQYVIEEKHLRKAPLYPDTIQYWISKIGLAHFSLPKLNSEYHDTLTTQLNTTLPSSLNESLLHFCKVYQVEKETVILSLIQIVLSIQAQSSDVLFAYKNTHYLQAYQQQIDNQLQYLLFRAQSDLNASLLQVVKLNTRQLSTDAYYSQCSLRQIIRELRKKYVLKSNTTNVLVEAHEPITRAFINEAGIFQIQESLCFDAMSETLAIHYAWYKDGLRFTWVAHPHVADLLPFIAETFVTVSEQLLNAPKKPLQEITLLSKSLDKMLYQNWHKPKHAYPVSQTLIDSVEAFASAKPSQIALTDNQKKLSYYLLNKEANQLAHFISPLINPKVSEPLIIIYLSRRAEAITSILAALKLGGGYVYIDTEYPAERVQYIIQDAQTEIIITEEKLYNQITTLAPHCRCISIDNVAIQKELANSSEQNLNRSIMLDNVAYVIYTSGTTGHPKGIVLTHRNIINYIHSVKDLLTLEQPQTHGLIASLSFDAMVLDIWGALLHGNQVVLLQKEEYLNPQVFEQSIHEYQITQLFVPVALTNVFGLTAPHCFNQLKYISFGGEKPNPKALLNIKRHCPGLTLYNIYGPSEITVACTFDKIDLQSPYFNCVPIGKPLANYVCYVVDSVGRLLPPGAIGELWVSSESVARQYLGKPEKTAEVFIANPFQTTSHYHESASPHLYRTGDRVRWLPNGSLEFIERADNQVKIRGFRIELDEIRLAIKSYPSVDDAVVIPHQFAEGMEKELVGFVQTQNVSLSENQIVTHIQLRLPKFMIPTRWKFIKKLPSNINGKIDYPSLIKLYLNDEIIQKNGNHHLSKIQAQLLHILEEILHTRLNIGPHEDIFTLGIHSLIITRFVVQIHKKLNVKLAIKDIFALRTLEGLEELIINTTPSKNTPKLTFHKNPDPHIAPTTSLQEGCWTLSQKSTDCSENILFDLILTGPIHVPVLIDALCILHQRHEALRTSFTLTDAGLQQFIHEEINPHIECEDITTLPLATQYQSILTHINQLKKHHFDTNHAPLCRFSVIRENAHKTHLFCLIHHAVYDGSSHKVFVEDLNAVYCAIQHHQPLPKRANQYEFKDYAYSLQQWLARGELEYQADYWKKIAHQSPITHLTFPRDNCERATQESVINQRIILSKEMIKKIDAAIQTHQLSRFSWFFSVLFLTLHRIAQENDISILTVTANRNHEETENVIGCLINTAVVHMKIERLLTAVTYMKKLHNECLQMLDHQEFPADKQKALFDSNESVLSNVLYAYQAGVLLNGHFNEHANFEIQELMPGPNSDVTFIVEEIDDSLVLNFRFNPAAMSVCFSETVVHAFEIIQHAILENPLQPAVLLPIIDESIHHRLVEQSMARIPLAKAPQMTLCDLFDRSTEKYPNRIAIYHRNEAITYQRLSKRINSIACWLKNDAHLKQGQFVLLHFTKGINAVIAMLAVLKAGGAYVILDPTQPTERLSYIIKDSSAALLISESIFETSALETHDWQKILEVAQHYENVDFKSHAEAEDICYLIYTSGSTGLPKGTLLQHQSVVRFLQQEQHIHHIKPDDVFTCCHSLAFDYSVKEIFHALAFGAAVVLVDKEVLLDPQALLTLIINHRVTFFCQTPSSFVNFIEACQLQKPDYLPRRIYLAGENLNLPSLSGWFQLANHQQTRLYNTYGLTETTCGSCLYEIHANDVDAHRYTPLGKPFSDQSFYVLDEYLNPVPNGMMGELYIGGAGLAVGYWQQLDLTRKRFLLDPFSTEANALMYKTGDLVIRDEQGCFYYVGRLDTQINLRGLRIELGEIEAILSRHPEVNQVLVMNQHIDNTDHMIAYLTLNEGYHASETTQEGFKSFILSSLPSYMLPSYFCVIDKFPMTNNGKIDRKKLPIPQLSANTSYVAPATDVERQIANIWADVLNYPASTLSVTASLYEIGGNSLQLGRILYRLKRELPELATHLHQLGNTPSIRHMAGNFSEVQQSQTLELAMEDTKLANHLNYNPAITAPKIKTIFITGTTGYLGIYCLKDLLLHTDHRILCGVRGPEPEMRQLHAWQHYFADIEYPQHRIEIIEMDLTQPKLGITQWQQLAEDVDIVIHNAAWVHHLYDYEQLKTSNVMSTQALLELCSLGKAKRMCFISTLSAASAIRDGIVLEEPPTELFTQTNGYILSKYVSERLVAQAIEHGLEAQILRPGNISCDSMTGQIDAKRNHVLLFIKGCIQLGVAPNDLHGTDGIDFTPVDTVSRTICAFSQDTNCYGHTWHLVHPCKTLLIQLWQWLNQMGYSIKVCSYQEWAHKIHQVDESNALFPLLSLYPVIETPNDMDNPYVATEQTVAQMKMLHLEYPVIDEKFFRLLVNYLQSTGFLSA